MIFVVPIALALIMVCTGVSAFAQPASHEVWAARDTARGASNHAAEVASAPPEDHFADFVLRQAEIEVQLGLRHYAELDDYRAISAFKRYQHLRADDPNAQFLAALMIGQVYHRNDKPELSALSFERASEVAQTPYHRTFAYLMGLQQLCLPLSFYLQCRYRLTALSESPLEPELADLVEYQLLYTDVVLRQPLTAARAQAITAPQLREHAVALLDADAAFDALPRKRPWLSGTLSAVLPGLGQLANGRPVDALLAFGVNGALGAGTYLAFARADNVALGVSLSVLLAGFYVGNIVNAVVDARRINADRYLAFFEQLKKDHWARVGFVIQDDEVLFSYGFDWPGPQNNKQPQE